MFSAVLALGEVAVIGATRGCSRLYEWVYLIPLVPALLLGRAISIGRRSGARVALVVILAIVLTLGLSCAALLFGTPGFEACQ